MTQKLLAIAQAISMQLKNAFFALTRLKLQIMYNDDFKMLIERLWQSDFFLPLELTSVYSDYAAAGRPSKIPDQKA